MSLINNLSTGMLWKYISIPSLVNTLYKAIPMDKSLSHLLDIFFLKQCSGLSLQSHTPLLRPPPSFGAGCSGPQFPEPLSLGRALFW